MSWRVEQWKFLVTELVTSLKRGKTQNVGLSQKVAWDDFETSWLNLGCEGMFAEKSFQIAFKQELAS